MNRKRQRSWFVLCTVAIAVAACTDHPTGIDRLLSAGPSLDPVAGECYIGKINPDPGGSPTWWGTSTPTVDTTCGVIVTFSFPRTNTPELWFQNYFYWIHVESGLYPKSTGYQIGSYNDGINGPITYTFSQTISEFSLKVWGASVNVDIGPGHYMLAYDAIAGGNLVDSVSFGPGVNNIYNLREDKQTVSDSSIRRVVVYMPLLGPNANGDYSIPTMDRLKMRQATFVKAPCPPTSRPELDDPNIRENMFKALDSTLADPLRRERAGAGYRYNGQPTFYQFDLGSVVGNTECASSYQAMADTSFTVVFYFHTHGLTPPARTTSNCTTLPVGTRVAKGPSGCASVVSTSPCDLAQATTIGRKMYIIDRYDLYEVVPGMRTNRTGSYNKKWKVDRVARCFV